MRYKVRLYYALTIWVSSTYNELAEELFRPDNDNGEKW